MLKRVMAYFWNWYERHYTLNIVLSSGLFLLQLIHLYWLTTAVVAVRIFNSDLFFSDSKLLETMITLVDFTEIPALLSVSLIYINDLRKGFAWKPLWYLFFLNSQWLHIFWITDEFIIEALGGIAHSSLLPHWLVWVAIFIDYLEIPVIIDTIKRSLISLKSAFGVFR